MQQIRIILATILKSCDIYFPIVKISMDIDPLQCASYVRLLARWWLSWGGVSDHDDMSSY